MKLFCRKIIFRITEYICSCSNIEKSAFTLAEVLVTLGIIGVVSALIVPAVMTNIEKQKNLAVLSKAYADLQEYIKMFDIDKECDGNLSNCAPNSGEFALNFARYLHEKQGFMETDGVWFRYYTLTPVKDGSFSDAMGGGFVPQEGLYENDTLPKCVIAKSGTYMFCINVHMYDNYYHMNGDKFRAQINIYTDSNKFYKFGTGYWNRNALATLGKNIFVVLVMNSEKAYPNGAKIFSGGGHSWYYTDYWANVKTCNPEISSPEPNAGSGCFGRIVEDGWKIKYKY